MSAVITNKFRFSQAASFIDSFANNNIYVAIAKSSPWTSNDGVGVSENVPGTPTDTASQDTKDFNQILGLKLIPSTGVSYVVPRVNWTTGTVYTMYDDQDVSGNPIYVMNPNTYAVYKCIWNNYGATSTAIPTSTGTPIFTTADNYQWKYMFTLLPVDISVFLNNSWIPIRDKANATLAIDQLAVQTAAINGGIHAIKIVNAGSGYTNGTFAISGSNVVGDGTGFTGTLTVTGGIITGVSVTSAGTGYSTCTLTVPAAAGAGTNGSIRAVISPIGGHGADPVVELSAFYVMATTTLNYSESNELTTANDYRKIMLVQNPLLANGNAQSVPGASVKTNVIKLAYTGVVNGSFLLDETVNFGSSASQGILVDHDTTNKILSFTETSGTTIPPTAVATGVTSGATVTYTAVTYPFFKSKTGYIIYKDFRKAIMRSFDQTETLSTIIEF